MMGIQLNPLGLFLCSKGYNPIYTLLEVSPLDTIGHISDQMCLGFCCKNSINQKQFGDHPATQEQQLSQENFIWLLILLLVSSCLRTGCSHFILHSSMICLHCPLTQNTHDVFDLATVKQPSDLASQPKEKRNTIKGRILRIFLSYRKPQLFIALIYEKSQFFSCQQILMYCSQGALFIYTYKICQHRKCTFLIANTSPLVMTIQHKYTIT